MSVHKNKRNKKHYEWKRVINIMQELHKDVHAKRTWLLSCWYKVGNKRICGLREWGTWDGDIEIVSPDMPSHIHRYKNLPTGVLWREWKMAEEEGTNYIEDVENYQGPLDIVIHASRFAKSFYGVGLFNEDKIIGVLGCDWMVANGFSYTEAVRIEEAARNVNEHINLGDCDE